jgi:Cu2+-containing amine oxidase
MKKEMTKKLGVALLTGMLTLTGLALAAEDSKGVIEFVTKSYESSKAALQQIQKGDKEGAVSSIRNFRQQTKQITGSAASSTLQKANQSIQQAALDLEAGNMAAALANMTKGHELMSKVYRDTVR